MDKLQPSGTPDRRPGKQEVITSSSRESAQKLSQRTATKNAVWAAAALGAAVGLGSAQGCQPLEQHGKQQRKSENTGQTSEALNAQVSFTSPVNTCFGNTTAGGSSDPYVSVSGQNIEVLFSNAGDIWFQGSNDNGATCTSPAATLVGYDNIGKAINEVGINDGYPVVCNDATFCAGGKIFIGKGAKLDVCDYDPVQHVGGNCLSVGTNVNVGLNQSFPVAVYNSELIYASDKNNGGNGIFQLFHTPLSNPLTNLAAGQLVIGQPTGSNTSISISESGEWAIVGNDVNLGDNLIFDRDPVTGALIYNPPNSPVNMNVVAPNANDATHFQGQGFLMPNCDVFDVNDASGTALIQRMDAISCDTTGTGGGGAGGQNPGGSGGTGGNPDIGGGGSGGAAGQGLGGNPNGGNGGSPEGGSSGSAGSGGAVEACNVVTVTGDATVTNCDNAANTATVDVKGPATLNYFDKTLTVDRVIANSCTYDFSDEHVIRMNGGFCVDDVFEAPSSTKKYVYADDEIGVTLGAEGSHIKTHLFPDTLNSRLTEGKVDVSCMQVMESTHYLYNNVGCDPNNLTSCEPIPVNPDGSNAMPVGTVECKNLTTGEYFVPPPGVVDVPPPEEPTKGCGSCSTIGQGQHETQDSLAAFGMAAGLAFLAYRRRNRFTGLESNEQ